MKSVEPIRDKKKDRCHEGHFGFRKIWATKFGAFFDRDQYSLSNLRFKTVKIKGCARNFPWAGDRQRTSGHEGTKNGQTQFGLHFEQIAKSDS